MPQLEPLEIVPKDGTRTTGGGPAPTIEHDPDFYFDESPVIIKVITVLAQHQGADWNRCFNDGKVENKLFKIHKYQLLESETFSDMFKVPKGASNQVEEGSSPEHPIALDGVSASDFKALLKVLYVRHFSNTYPSPEASLIVPAFRLAHMWNFADLRSHLLPLAEKVLGDVDKIVLAKELGIQEWLLPTYLQLCRRQEPLNIEEATKLGMHSLLMVSHMREKPHFLKHLNDSGQATLNYCSNCVGMSYTGSDYRCDGCNSYRAYFRPSVASGNNNVNVETQLKKWVEDGCVFSK